MMPATKNMATFSLSGISVSRGIAIGRAHLVSHVAMDTQHYLVPEEKVEAEVARFQQALDAVRNEIETMQSTLPKDAPVELGAFLEVHGMLLSDSMISLAPMNIIRTRRYNAEWALLTQVEALSTRFDNIEDPYLRERKADIRQISERILRVLTGVPANNFQANALAQEDRADMIVVAYDISPTDMLQFRDDTFAGFVSEIGGRNSHAAIVARSIDTPAIFGLSGALSLIRQDDWLIVDAEAGIVIVNPTSLVLEQYRAIQVSQLKAKKKLSRLKKMPTVSLDGVPVTLMANIEFPDDCASVLANGADGIGLFRSEFLFMGRTGGVSKLPSEEEQFTAYKKTVVAMKGRTVIIRTLDIGADKHVDGLESTSLNPALGRRAIRYCLAQPDLFLTQLRAILRASAFGKVKLLIPMLVHGFEIDQTLAIIEQAKAQLRVEGIKFDEDIEVGAMIEVPAAIFSLPLFLSRLDFLSIGTNDLIQYALAIDRVDPEVAYLYNPLHPAILSMLQMTIYAAQQANVPVAVCGELAGDPQMTWLLLGMGLREFSMHPTQLLNVKQAVLTSNIATLTEQVEPIMALVEEDAIQQAVSALGSPK